MKATILSGAGLATGLVLSLGMMLFVAPAAKAKDMSFYCIYTGLGEGTSVRYIFGPVTHYRLDACRLAEARCRAQRLRSCRLYGRFRIA